MAASHSFIFGRRLRWAGVLVLTVSVFLGLNLDVATPCPGMPGLRSVATNHAPGLQPEKERTPLAFVGPCEDMKGASTVVVSSFDELFEELVVIYLDGMDTKTQADPARMAGVEASARALLQRLTIFRDAGQSALDVALAFRPRTGSEDRDLERQMRRTIAGQLLHGALKLNRERSQLGHGQAAQINRDLVSSILASFPNRPDLIPLLGPCLDGQPYLQKSHEDQVLLLAEVAVRQLVMRDLVSSFLFTVWTNIRETGAIPGDVLTSIVLAHRQSENPSKRIAAWRFLLANANPALQELVIQQVLDKKDLGAMRILGLSLVATENPDAALKVLKRMVPLCAGQLTSAYLTLGYKDRALIREEYESCLATGTFPYHRAQLINASVVAGCDLAKVAWEHDPEIRVRRNALLILSGCGAVADADAALHSALECPEFCGGPAVSVVVAAFEAVAGRSGNPNQIARLLIRLEVNPFLAAADRKALDRIREQYLPGH